MSRAVAIKSEPAVRIKSDPDDSETPRTDMCPVCKTSKYMRPNMHLQINTACYHMMCVSCIDRLFGHGPALCPIQYCKSTLRKRDFRDQTFDDIKVEREVDIRRKLAVVFNKQEEDFESLRDFNDYLDDVEDITFNMVNGIDKDETKARFDAYQQLHNQEILENASAEQKEQLSFAAARKANSAKITKSRSDNTAKDAKKRAGGGPIKRETVLPTSRSNGNSNLVIKGLKAKVKAEPEAPIDPFGGIQFIHQYSSIQDHYVWTKLPDPSNRELAPYLFGGWKIPDFANRALCEAFSGLGVMITDEAIAREKVQQGVVETAAPTKEIKMEGPF